MRGRQNAKGSTSSLPKVAKTLPEYQSPFAIPQDAQIFRMKQRQKQRKRQQKQRNDGLKIWQKGVRKQGISIRELNQLGKDQKDEGGYQTKTSFIQAAKTAIQNRVRATQPMHKFVGKTRETLVFQMLIDHKRQKINEFQQLTKLHRKGLERAEQMLQEDMENFNNYLAQNKKDARDAIKKAETQTRRKNQKVAVIKQKLEVQADLTGKNMSKKETLQNLKKYRNFLLSLSPQLTDEQRNRKHAAVDPQTIPAGKQQLSDDQQSDHMYFRQPQQLASIFHSLQQSNLFLITNLKQIQQEMQQARNALTHKRQTLARKRGELLGSKAQIAKQIATVQEQIQQLRFTTNKDQISEYYAALQTQIARVAKEAKQSGMPVAQQKNVSALLLLKQVQKKIQEQLLTLRQLKQQAPHIVKQEQKRCVQRKRDLKKQKMSEQQQEKGMKQKGETSPTREKRKGRPIMARSIIKQEKKKQEEKYVEPEEEIERRKYLL